MLFCRLLIFFKINFFRKIFQEYHKCQTVWTLIRPRRIASLIWVQTVCKGYQQKTMVDKELNSKSCRQNGTVQIRMSTLHAWPLKKKMTQYDKLGKVPNDFTALLNVLFFAFKFGQVYFNIHIIFHNKCT